MLKATNTIIGINPGSRYLGFAVLKDDGPLDWGVKIVSGKGTKQKSAAMENIVSKIIDRYSPDVVVLKRINPVRSSVRLGRLVEAIKSVLQKKGVTILEYSVKDVENSLSPDVRISKKKVAGLIATKYPILSYELNKEKTNLNPYHIRMFEAVALGTVYYKQINKVDY